MSHGVQQYFSYGELCVLVQVSVLQFFLSNLCICLIFITNQQKILIQMIEELIFHSAADLFQGELD